MFFFFFFRWGPTPIFRLVLPPSLTTFYVATNIFLGDVVWETNPVLKKIGSKQLPSTSDLQSCNPSIHQPTNQSNKLVNQSTNQSINQSHQPTNQPSNQTTNSIFNWIWIKSEARFWAPLCLAEFRPQRGWRKGLAESLHAGLREWDQGYLTGMVRHNVGPPKNTSYTGDQNHYTSRQGLTFKKNASYRYLFFFPAIFLRV